LIVTPYLAAANNGNWRTAARWAQLLSRDYRTIVQACDAAIPEAADALVALHARRSHAAVGRWRERHEHRLIVALTGTDLYRDVPEHDPAALASLAAADRLIVLQEDALNAVPARYRPKASVVYQSAPLLARWGRKSRTRLACVFVGHLRPEKDPLTVLEAWRQLPPSVAITLTIVGEGLDKALVEQVSAAAARDGRIQWLGPQPHGSTRQAIRRAHVLICASRMEGGANVVVEAITSGTAVVASRMSGNLGMLGRDYRGYFEVGDPAGVAALLLRCRADPGFLGSLEREGASRAPLFAPEAERERLRAVVDAVVGAPS
jgi:putative glycosyltransferase (TIGR04348 family)